MANVIINHNKCEGKKDCCKVCPEHVFEMRKPEEDASWLAKLKVRFHGGKQAFVAREAACTGCMECVTVCHENAITVTL